MFADYTDFVADKVHTPRNIETRRSRHILLAICMTLLASALWFAPLPIPAIVKPFLVILVGVLPFAAIVAFKNMFLIILLFIVFSFFRIHEAFPQIRNFKIPLLLALGSLAMIGWNLFMTRSLKPYWLPQLWPFALFFGFVTITMPLSEIPKEAYEYWVDVYVKIAIMTLAIAWAVRRPQEFSMTAKALILAGIAVGCVALYNKANGIGLVEGTRVTISRQYRSVLGDPNDLALVLMFPMSFAATFVMMRDSWLDKLLGVVGTVIIFAAVIATQSRGGLLGIVAVFGVIGNHYIKSKMVLGAIAAVGLLGLMAMAGINDREVVAEQEGLDASAQSRLHSWETAIDMAVAKPFYGVGLDNFYHSYFYYTKHWDGVPHAVHNTWLGVLAETGIIGFIAFMAMVGMAVYTNLKYGKILKERKAPNEVQTASLSALSGLAGVCVSGTFLTQGFTWPIYILVALSAAITKYAIDFKEETQEDYENGVFDPPKLKAKSRWFIWEKSKTDVPLYHNDDPDQQHKKTHAQRMLWEPERELPNGGKAQGASA